MSLGRRHQGECDVGLSVAATIHPFEERDGPPVQLQLAGGEFVDHPQLACQSCFDLRLQEEPASAGEGSQMRERVTQAETFPALRDKRTQSLQRHAL